MHTSFGSEKSTSGFSAGPAGRYFSHQGSTTASASLLSPFLCKMQSKSNHYQALTACALGMGAHDRYTDSLGLWTLVVMSGPYHHDTHTDTYTHARITIACTHRSQPPHTHTHTHTHEHVRKRSNEKHGDRGFPYFCSSTTNGSGGAN